MKRIFLIIILSLFCGLIYAENKIYYDEGKKIEVCDVSGIKTLAQINIEFNGNFRDVTAEREIKIEQNKLEAKEKSIQKENIREQKREEIKQKLGLSEQDWKNLIEVLGLTEGEIEVSVK